MSRQLEIHPAVKKLRALTSSRPTLAVVLGSGFQPVLSDFRIEAEITFSSLPGFPAAHVSGHPGKLVIGRAAGCPVLLMAGRAHFYEGHELSELAVPIRVLAGFGIRDLLLTNAAGGIRRSFHPGDFMLARDHINFMGVNPLRGRALEGLPRFVDMSCAYDPKLSAALVRVARSARIKLHRGVYLAVSGPSFETPAEIRAFARLGADAVGMSTVPEVVVARQCGMRVAALSCITNRAAGLSRNPLSHTEVLEVGERVKESSAKLLLGFIKWHSKNVAAAK